MSEVRVKAGQEHFGTKDKVTHRYGPGDTMTVPDEHLKVFMRNMGDKFEVVGGEVAKEEEPETPVEFDVKTADKKSLLTAAEELGLEVDARWSEKRLREEVEKALTGE